MSVPDANVYLDNAATTALDARVLEAMRPWLGVPANPSSRHRLGVRAAEALDEARSRVARAVGARAREVVFTSGGTEADNLAVLGGARARAKHGRHVVVGPTEHAGVREAARALGRAGFAVETARLRASGALDLEHLAGLLRPDTVLVAQMLASNELGTIYPCREVARLVRARAPHALLHVDAVQAFGKLDLAPIVAAADAVAISAHKVHGPQGAGALILRAPVEPLSFGGGQEHGLRSGTENVAGWVGFGRACELAAASVDATAERTARLRARLVAGLGELAGVEVLAPGESEQDLLPAIVAVVVPAPAEVTMNHLDARGVTVSAGSACQSRKKDISPALAALGLDDERARRVLRFSFSRTSTEHDVDRALAALREVCRELAAVRS